MTKSTINCKFCGNCLAKPTGGKAQLFGVVHKIIDGLPDIPIKTNSKQTPIKTTTYLLDTMVIHQLITGVPLQTILDSDLPASLELIVLDRILIETKHMEKQEYNDSLEVNDIVDKLNTALEKTAKVTALKLNHASAEIMRANDLFESNKYVNDKGIALSETDCILLQMSLKLNAKLITFDQTLADALKKEKDLQTKTLN